MTQAKSFNRDPEDAAANVGLLSNPRARRHLGRAATGQPTFAAVSGGGRVSRAAWLRRTRPESQTRDGEPIRRCGHALPAGTLREAGPAVRSTRASCHSGTPFATRVPFFEAFLWVAVKRAN